VLARLADILLRRGDPAGRSEAVDLLREAISDTGPALLQRHCLPASIRLGDLAAEAGGGPDALLGYRRAVELLAVAAWPGLRRAVQEERLADVPGVATAAAAQAVPVDPALAVELVEQGRSVLWTHQLHRRTDLSRLAAARPALAARLDEISAWFERPVP
jgi:hypothetical protein